MFRDPILKAWELEMYFYNVILKLCLYLNSSIDNQYELLYLEAKKFQRI